MDVCITDTSHRVATSGSGGKGLLRVFILEVVGHDMARFLMGTRSTGDEDIAFYRGWQDAKETVVDVFA